MSKPDFQPTLVGPTITVRPITPGDWTELYAAGSDPEIWKALKSPPEGANSIEWPIEQVRSNEAAARIFWPLGNTRIEKRLRLIQAPVLLLWGENDKIMPRGYAETFARGISGKTVTKIIAGAGHLAELDKPAEVAEAILDFTA